MELLNFRKETSERSDSRNSAKRILTERTNFHYDSIEGCNQNVNNIVTHLLERARVDISGTDDFNITTILNSIKNLEDDKNQHRLLRKIRFANYFDISLTYILYCNENQNVFVFTIPNENEISFVRSFNNFPEFSQWIKGIKGWESSKPYRESDLPQFDIALRAAGTAWPTNIDCFISNANNIPCSILEFQNTKKATVKEHCNNDYFLCKYISSNDIRRWTSQEILRVQSRLKLFIITWSATEKNYIFKRVDRITIPNLPYPNWDLVNVYKNALSNYVNKNRNELIFNQIASKYSSFNFSFANKRMIRNINNPVLSIEAKTFPFIYYVNKEYIEDNTDRLIELTNEFIN